MGFVVISCILAVIVLVYMVATARPKPAASNNGSTYTSAQKTTISYSKESNPDDFYTWIAGVNFRCSQKDIGGFLGVVKREPTNPHDKNAVAIYRSSGKKLGYIAKSELRIFNDWTNNDNLPCVGFVEPGDTADFFGKVKVLDTSESDTEFQIIKFVRWLIEKKGVEYVPDGFEMATASGEAPKTKEEWLAIIDKYLNR